RAPGASSPIIVLTPPPPTASVSPSASSIASDRTSYAPSQPPRAAQAQGQGQGPRTAPPPVVMIEPANSPVHTLETGMTDLQPGQPVGEYVVERRLGEGGMAVVYAGIQPLIGKKVAIKLLAPALAAEPEIVRRFIQEARAVNQIQHRHIVDIFSFGRLPDG